MQSFSRRRFMLLASAVTAFMAFPLAMDFNQAVAQKTQPNYTLAMNILWNNGDARALESSFKRMKQLGIREARTDWEWRAVEKTKGTYDWTATDRLMQLAKKYGVTILPIVHYAPDWALLSKGKADGGYQVAPAPEYYKAYGDFLAASIDRYGPSGGAAKAKFAFTPIRNWQVWNEPNNKDFWGPKPDAGEFVKFMRTVNESLGKRRGKVGIVHAGLSKADFEFLWQLWEKDSNYGRYFDVMAVHPYFFNPKGGVRAVDALDDDKREYAALGLIGSPNDGGYLSKVFNIQLFLTLKNSPKPIWITEIGFMAGSKNQWAVSEQEQMGLARQTLTFINDRLTKKPFGVGARGDIAANVQKVYWFILDDYNFPNDTGNFGVYRLDKSQRPIAGVIKNFAP